MKELRLTKELLVIEISELIGVEPPKMSTGSTEPKELFVIINKVLGLGLDLSKSKPNIARDLVELAGMTWDPECESRGSTVTLLGLSKTRDAIAFFLNSST